MIDMSLPSLDSDAQVPAGSGGLSVDGLSKSYGKLDVLCDISFGVDPAAWTTIIGPSGCGKTTLLRIIAGLEYPTGGKVRFSSRRDRTDLVSFLPQHDTLLPWRTALGNLLLPAEIERRRRDSAEAEARSLLVRFGLAGFEGFYPGRLSGGMRQRVALIRTFLAHREILLLDEPLGALDPLTRIQLQDWLLEVWRELRKTILLVTHDVEEAVVLSDHIVLLTERPARVESVVDVGFPRPRSRDGEKTVGLRGRLLSQLIGNRRHV
ncbi:MAG TPA: ABC transporter ATP-binding protein [Candidatus Acetothermia bacterium]|nr:ABC transporter ATP-binding protein [Candidatus Acetothermia bacterium]